MIYNLNSMPLKPVFHYCSIESFFSIITSAELFLSHSQYLNDTNETKWIKKTLNAAHTHLGIKFDETCMRKIKTCFTNHQPNSYLGCFSQDKDTLSQWRSYADDGFGVSIGFDSNRLKKIGNQYLKFFKVIYDDEMQTRALLEILENTIPSQRYNIIPLSDEELRHKVRLPYFQPEEKFNGVNLIALERELNNYSTSKLLNLEKPNAIDKINAISTSLKQLVIFTHRLKSSAFYEEKEVRLCYLPSPIKEEIKLAASDKIYITSLKHRCSNKRIIPFHTLNFANDKSILKEIVLGPAAKLDVKAVRSFLKNEGYNTKNIRISRSEASYQN